MTFQTTVHLHTFLVLTLVMIVGMVVGSVVWGVSMFWLILLAAALLFSIVLRRWRHVASICLFLAVFMLGAYAMSHRMDDVHQPVPSFRHSFQAIVLSLPEPHGRVDRCDLLIASGPMAGQLVKASFLRDTIHVSRRSLTVGDGISAWSAMSPLRPYGPSGTSYVRYLQCHGFRASTLILPNRWARCEVSLDHLSMFQRARCTALRLRQLLLQRCRQLGLQGQSFAVVAAMTLGDKSLLTSETKHAYALSGASHVLALSGLHLGIIYMILSLLTLGRRYHALHQSLLVAAIWCYVVIVGMPTSVVRAAVMISVYALLAVVRRQSTPLNTMAFAAAILLLVNPLNLFDVGFQLSFTAVLFILLLYRPLSSIIPEPWLQRHPLVRWVWTLAVVTCVAQLGVAPLVAYYFSRLPVYFLLTGFIVIPAATAVLYLAAALLLTSPVAALQQFVATLLMLLVMTLNRLLSHIATWPSASVFIPHLSPFHVVIIYTLVFIGVGLFLRWRNKALLF